MVSAWRGKENTCSTARSADTDALACTFGAALPAQCAHHQTFSPKQCPSRNNCFTLTLCYTFKLNHRNIKYMPTV